MFHTVLKLSSVGFFGISWIPPAAISKLVLKEPETAYRSGRIVMKTMRIRKIYRKTFATGCSLRRDETSS